VCVCAKTPCPECWSDDSHREFTDFPVPIRSGLGAEFPCVLSQFEHCVLPEGSGVTRIYFRRGSQENLQNEKQFGADIAQSRIVSVGTYVEFREGYTPKTPSALWLRHCHKGFVHT